MLGEIDLLVIMLAVAASRIAAALSPTAREVAKPKLVNRITAWGDDLSMVVAGTTEFSWGLWVRR